MNGTAIVTGANGDIGVGICEALSTDGWTVVAADITMGSSNVEKRAQCYEVTLDVRDEESVVRGFASVVDDIGPVACVVNNAGVVEDRVLRNMTLEEWRRVVTVNLDGAFLMTRELIRHLRETGLHGGRLVNISSISGKLGNFGQGNYAASKAGLIGLTKVTAREIAQLRATANAVMPGIIDTEMAHQIPKDILERRLEEIPLQRLGEVGEVAEVVRWLCSERAAYVTGAVIEVTGGRGM